MTLLIICKNAQIFFTSYLNTEWAGHLTEFYQTKDYPSDDGMEKNISLEI